MDVYNTRKTVSKGTVLRGYDNPKPIPVPGHTRYWISTVLPRPVSRLIYRRMGDKSDDTKKAQFPYYLQAYSIADKWYHGLSDNEKKNCADVKKAFQERWPRKMQVGKTEEEYEEEIIGRKLKADDLGKKEKIAGMEVYSHVA